jgi:hypothetical protein
VIKDQVNQKLKIKSITEELLNKLNEAYPAAKKSDEDNISNISETSSAADEKEIQQKLHEILTILNQQPTSNDLNDVSYTSTENENALI